MSQRVHRVAQIEACCKVSLVARVWVCPITKTFEDPPIRYVAVSRGEPRVYATALYVGVVLQFQTTENFKDSPAHSYHYLQKRRVWFGGVTNGEKKAPKLRSVGESVLQKYAR